ncbi:hypothetical protein MNBD_GAMMA09-2265 [hydrothermal vent metagenome]|uniref:Uncharacterized protein n=1 Tax=hydrothermal vent metagenome TaxID=652676 RepID=A0A3B0YGR4_9ZZZZ
MKAAIIILSNPDTDSEEALGRLFNGLAAAYDFKQKGDEVSVLFQGTGSRWPRHIINETHPTHALYKAIEDKIVGVSSGCADVFGATASVVESGFELISNSPVPGTSGLPSLQALMADGYQVITF